MKVAGGVLDTQNIEEVLRGLVRGARTANNFDQLPIPFRAVATDMLSGQMVVLDRGDISVAMRTSMAVPGVFTRVVMGDRILADGGLMRNLPVDVALLMRGRDHRRVAGLAPPRPMTSVHTESGAPDSRCDDRRQSKCPDREPGRSRR